jgi:hypothetical protein
MSKFDDFSDQWVKGVEAFTLKSYKDFKDAAITDANAFFSEMDEDLQRWTGMLSTGELSEREFASLVKGEKDLLELHSLQQAGLVKVRVDMFTNGVLDLTVSTAIKVFLA